MIFRLVHAEARQRALEAVRNAPEDYTVAIKKPTRNNEQNAALHALLQEISQTRKWAGQRLSTDDWKRLLTAGWCKATGRGVKLVPALDGQGFDAIYQRTSTLSKSEMSELIDYIQAWKAENEQITA